MITTKKVSDYFKFMRNILQKNYKGKIKHPSQLKDDEREEFFNEVRKEWEKHKSNEKTAQTHAISDVLDQIENLGRSVFNLKELKDKKKLPEEMEDYIQKYEKELSSLAQKYIQLFKSTKQSYLESEVFLEKKLEVLKKFFESGMLTPDEEKTVEKLRKDLHKQTGKWIELKKKLDQEQKRSSLIAKVSSKLGGNYVS